jgi:hypothetical protein
MVHTNKIGDKDGRTRYKEVLSSRSLNHNTHRCRGQTKDRRSKSHPNVKVRSQLRYPSDGDIGNFLQASSDENLLPDILTRPDSEDAVARRNRILRKYSTSYNISKRFWSKLGNDDAEEDSQMEHWSKIKSSVSLGTVISRVFVENKDKKKLINPFKVRYELKKVSHNFSFCQILGTLEKY